MTERFKVMLRIVLRGSVELLLKPALVLGACGLGILLLGYAQRTGWISGEGVNSHGGHLAGAPVAEDTLYICPMMCTPPLHEPGRCPVCGMELVPSASSSGAGDSRSIVIDPVARRIANIQTAVVESRPVWRQIRAVGQLNYDESTLKTLAAYVDGRLERVYADYKGVVVSQGDHLALLYSPQLYTAQTELLSARRAADRMSSSPISGALDGQSLYQSTRQKLVDLGMTDQQIQHVEASGQPTTRIELVAPIHGTVLEKLAAEGDYVKTGQAIYRLADLTTLWLMLELFPDDAAAVHFGQRVTAEVQSNPGVPIVGRVAFVDPVVSPRTRTVGVRVVIPNPEGHLKVGDYATAAIDVPVLPATAEQKRLYDPDLAGKWISPRHPDVVEDQPGLCRRCGIALVPASTFGYSDQPVADCEQLVIPRNSVLMAGAQSVVYVEVEPGRFELRLVEPGPRIGDEIVIFKGLTAGELVATSGNFLIDSEMQLAGNPSLIDPVRASEPPTAEDLTPDLPPIGTIEILEEQQP